MSIEVFKALRETGIATLARGLLAVRFGLLAVLSVAIVGCGQRAPSRVYPDKPDPQAGPIAIELYDADKDGSLDGKELDKVPGLKAAIQQVDSNKDGKISAEEISARIQKWADSKIGRMSVGCLVMHNGRPLDGATVRFVPERFLGGEMKTAVGTTDMHGVASVTAPRESGEPYGVCPGFYRVEITKSGENIPAEYNIQTRLGQEAAPDAAGLTHGLAKFDLTY